MSATAITITVRKNFPENITIYLELSNLRSNIGFLIKNIYIYYPVNHRKCLLMLKWITFFLTGFISLSACAQDKLFEEPIGWRGKDIELHTIADRDKNRNCLFLCKADSIRVFVLDSKQVVIQHFYINRLTDEQLLGGFIKGDTIYAFFQASAGISDLHVWTLNIAEGIGDDYTVPFAMRHERSVEHINCGDHFLYFAVSKKASQFAIYDFHAGNRCDTLRYQFPDGVWKVLTRYSGCFGRDMNVVEINPDEQMNPDMGHVPNKLYWMRDTLFLLMNNNYERGVTAVFSFDIANRKVDLRKIVHNNAATIEPPLEEYVDNSMLLDDRLYFVSAEGKKLNVQIRDFNSGKLLKGYTTGRDEDIDFKNTPIVQEGSFYNPGKRELAKTRQLIRKMVSGSAVLIASREDSGRVGLTIGAWQEMNTSGGGGMWMGGGVPGVPMTFVATAGYFRGSVVRSSRFKALLDSVTLQHVPGEITTDLGERIEQYTKGISIPEAGEALFRNGGRYVYAYYDRDDHKIKLTGF